MAEPRSEAPKPTPKELPVSGIRPFELELADRISKSEVLPTLKKMERVDYDFSKVDKGPNEAQVTELFGTREIADFAAQEQLAVKKRLRQTGEIEFNGKKYDAMRVVLTEPHNVEELETVSGYPSKVISALFLREIGGQPVEGKLRDKLEKLADKSAVGRKLRGVVTGLTTEGGSGTARRPEGEFPYVDLDQYDSVIFGLWANPVQTPDDGVVYEDAQVEVLHPDYSSSRRAMQYGLSTSFKRRQNAINSEPLRTDKSAEELHQEKVNPVAKTEEAKKTAASEDRVRPIPSRTAWFDFDGNNITATLKEAVNVS